MSGIARDCLHKKRIKGNTPLLPSAQQPDKARLGFCFLADQDVVLQPEKSLQAGARMRRGMAGGDSGCEALSCGAQPWSWSSWSLPAPTHAPALAIAPPHPCSAPVPAPHLLPSPPSEDCRGPARGKSAEVRGFFYPLPLPLTYQHTCARAGVGLRQPGPSITQASCLQGTQERH